METAGGVEPGGEDVEPCGVRVVETEAVNDPIAPIAFFDAADGVQRRQILKTGIDDGGDQHRRQSEQTDCLDAGQAQGRAGMRRHRRAFAPIHTASRCSCSSTFLSSDG